jgi:hypothetical protein
MMRLKKQGGPKILMCRHLVRVVVSI